MEIKPNHLERHPYLEAFIVFGIRHDYFGAWKKKGIGPLREAR